MNGLTLLPLAVAVAIVGVALLWATLTTQRAAPAVPYWKTTRVVSVTGEHLAGCRWAVTCDECGDSFVAHAHSHADMLAALREWDHHCSLTGYGRPS